MDSITRTALATQGEEGNECNKGNPLSQENFRDHSHSLSARLKLKILSEFLQMFTNELLLNKMNEKY